MKKNFNFLSTFVLILGITIFPLLALAQNNIINPGSDGTDPFGFGGKLDQIAAPYNPQTTMPLEQRVGEIIAIFLSLLGVVFLVLMLYAGFNWMVAGGDEEQIAKSRNTIRAAIIGLIIVIAAYALSVFIIGSLWGTGGVTGG